MFENYVGEGNNPHVEGHRRPQGVRAEDGSSKVWEWEVPSHRSTAPPLYLLLLAQIIQSQSSPLDISNKKCIIPYF